jgi:hypothetical protein
MRKPSEFLPHPFAGDVGLADRALALRKLRQLVELE